ncbi:hypothetical protein FDP41_007681 [Naegleria fowleri]|uniref:Equilibrative nucleoside transporter n=1 Tax=Naegleria fowleri TaxID=5763 RepID=A0A6A5C7M5_NAEFO|nr:uncharacterized protein FDP41_007681 [Naegleria fowleri]KAF0983766.1 hypothetical protein FDP41_007681 [Naegleria fowleri]
MPNLNRGAYTPLGNDEFYGEDDISLVTNPTTRAVNEEEIHNNNFGGSSTNTSERKFVSFAEKVSRTETKKLMKGIPRDAFSLARIMFLLMGSGVLVPGICYQLAVDWFNLIFPSRGDSDSFNFIDFLEYILSLGFNIGQLAAILLYTIFMWRKSVHTLKAQTFTVEQFIFMGYALNFVCVMVTLFINMVLVLQYGFNNKDDTYDKIFMLVCIVVLNCLVGVGSGVLSSAVISFAANFTWKYTVFFLVGLSLGNAVLSIFRLFSRLIWYDTAQGLFNSIILFFSFSAIIQVICIIAFIYLLRLPITKYCKEHYVNMQTPTRDLDEQIRISRLEKDMIMEQKMKEEADNVSFKSSESNELPTASTVGAINNGGEGEETEDNTQTELTEKPQETEDSNINELSMTWISLMKRLWSPGLGIFVTFLTTFSLAPGLITDIKFYHDSKVSWNPIVTLSIFNVFDCIGRALPNWKRTILLTHKQLWVLILLRLGFIPTVIFCVNPLLITQPIWYAIILALFGLTNGYCCSIGMASGPSIVKAVQQEKAAYMMSFFLNFGLFVGSAVGIGVGYLVHFAF